MNVNIAHQPWHSKGTKSALAAHNRKCAEVDAVHVEAINARKRAERADTGQAALQAADEFRAGRIDALRGEEAVLKNIQGNIGPRLKADWSAENSRLYAELEKAEQERKAKMVEAGIDVSKGRTAAAARSRHEEQIMAALTDHRRHRGNGGAPQAHEVDSRLQAIAEELRSVVRNWRA